MSEDPFELGRQAELDRLEREYMRTRPFKEQSEYWARKAEERKRRQLQRMQEGVMS